MTADAMEVLPWVFIAFLGGVILTLFIQQQATASPLGSPASISVLRDELGRIVSIQGAG